MKRAALIGALFFAVPAVAQPVCLPRDVMIERLADEWGEARQSIGIGGNGHVVETYANLESGTWSITVTAPSGTACLVASGTGFERLYETAPGGDPT